MIRSIIVDDEVKSQESLKKILISFCKNVEVLALCQNVASAKEAIAQFKPDVVFLDVQMQRETGFDLLSSLNTIDFDVIFTTAHSEYALQAIKYSAIDYLLKPIDVEDLQRALDRVERKHQVDFSEQVRQLLQNLKIGAPEKFKLTLPTSDGLIFVQASEILYCKASGNYTEIFMQNKIKHLISRPLKEYDDLLSAQNFFRVHHSYLINLSFIKSYVRGEGGYVIMSDDNSIDVSRRKKEAFLERIGTIV